MSRFMTELLRWAYRSISLGPGSLFNFLMVNASQRNKKYNTDFFDNNEASDVQNAKENVR